MSKCIHALVRFLPTTEGGRSQAPPSGVRSQVRLGSVHTSCVIRNAKGDEGFELGSEYPAIVELIFWKEYGDLVNEAMPLEFYEGDKLVARGKVVSISA